MKGLMQDWPLRVTTIIDHAARFHGDREIVTPPRSRDRLRGRPTRRSICRARKVAQALTKLGVKEGDVVATMAWNTARHLEAWYGIMGMGAVCHTLNPRLFAEQLVYIVNHAEDKIIFLDLTFVPILEGIADQLPKVKAYVIMTDKAHMPATKLKNALCFEEIVEAEDGNFKWAEVDENAACGLCYTSGTTGNPKGVLYSHRSNVLHSMAANMGDALGMKSTDAILPVVPMFHANAWGIAFAAPAVGAKIVMPGANMDGASIYELLDTEKVSDHGGRADRLADAAAISRKERRATAGLEPCRHRRFGRAALDDRASPTKNYDLKRSHACAA